MNDIENQGGCSPVLSTGGLSVFVKDAWVACFESDGTRPQIAKIREAYVLSGELLLDLVLYSHAGKRIGRESPACDGPRGFEPACPAEFWTPIEEPEFEYVGAASYHWGDRLRRRQTDNHDLTTGSVE